MKQYKGGAQQPDSISLNLIPAAAIETPTEARTDAAVEVQAGSNETMDNREGCSRTFHKIWTCCQSAPVSH